MKLIVVICCHDVFSLSYINIIYILSLLSVLTFFAPQTQAKNTWRFLQYKFEHPIIPIQFRKLRGRDRFPRSGGIWIPPERGGKTVGICWLFHPKLKTRRRWTSFGLDAWYLFWGRSQVLRTTSVDFCLDGGCPTEHLQGDKLLFPHKNRGIERFPHFLRGKYSWWNSGRPSWKAMSIKETWRTL